MRTLFENIVVVRHLTTGPSWRGDRLLLGGIWFCHWTELLWRCVCLMVINNYDNNALFIYF